MFAESKASRLNSVNNIHNLRLCQPRQTTLAHGDSIVEFDEEYSLTRPGAEPTLCPASKIN
jgi:hypothetical protein